MDDDFARVLREKIRTDMNNYVDDMADGSCKSYDAYQHLCGVIRGLALAERHLLDLLEMKERADD